jgi:hypothetical protein
MSKEIAPVSTENKEGLEESAIASIKSVVGARINMLQDEIAKKELQQAFDKFAENPKMNSRILALSLERYAGRVAPPGTEKDQLHYQKMNSAFNSMLGPYLANWQKEARAWTQELRQRAIGNISKGVEL